MSNIGQRSLFNQLLSNFLINDTRDLMIFFTRGVSVTVYFRALIVNLKRRFLRRILVGIPVVFEVRNLRRFLKVIFLHLTSTIRTRWGIVVQFSNDFLSVSLLMISIIWILGSLMSSSFVINVIVPYDSF